MINPDDVLYTPHPTEDPITSEQVQSHVNYLKRERGNANTFLHQVNSYQLLRMAGVMEDVILGDPAFTEVHREHVDYVRLANGGGEVLPAYEAEIIVEKAAIRDSLPPFPLAF